MLTEQATSPAGASPPAAPVRPIVRAAIASTATVILVLTAELTGLLHGAALLAAFALVVLAIPSAPHLSGRVLIATCVCLGWLPLIWVIHSPTEDITRIGALTALLAGTLAAWTLWNDPATRARRLAPRVGVPDLGLCVAGLFCAWMYWPLFRLSTDSSALRTLGLGWDAASHFDMAAMVRDRGSISAAADVGASEYWYWANYPKGFHAAAATVMEALGGNPPRSGGAELLAFSHATAIVALVAVCGVVAGLGALPAVRRRPFLGALLMAGATLTFTTAPGGGEMLLSGFTNFLVAVALLCCVPLLVVPIERLGQFGPTVALSGAVVGVAHNWAPLLVPAGVGVLVLVWPLRRDRWPHSRRGWWVLLATGTATTVAVAEAWRVLSSGPGREDFLLLPGGISLATPLEIASTGLAALAALTLVAVIARRVRASSSGSTMRAAALVSMWIAGWAVAGAIAAYQLAKIHALYYYFWKYASAMQLLSVVLAMLAVATVAAVGRPRRGTMIWAGSAVVLAMTLPIAAGLVRVNHSGVRLTSPPGLEARERWQRASGAVSGSPDLADALRAAKVAGRTRPTVMVPASLDGSTLPRLENQWLFALTHQWTTRTYAAVDAMWGDATPVDERPSDPRDAVAQLQRRLPDAWVVVSPETWRELRNAGDPQVDLTRVRHW